MALRTRSLLVVLLLAGAACGVARGSDPKAADVLYLRSARGVAVIEAGASAPSFSDNATPSGDWSTVVRSSIYRGTTSLVAADPRSGNALWNRTLDGRLVVKLVSSDGNTVVLAPANQLHYTLGRRETELVVEGRSMTEPRSLTIDGNYEPEAVSVDGSTLFLIRYLPAMKPDRYQVRQLDIASGKVGPVYTPDADLQKAMGGTARVQTAPSDGTRLYTLYTVGQGDSERAFVHTLALDDLWAHCIDLPAAFATKAESATAMALSPDGGRLYVVNSAIGRVAEVDTESLQVLRTAPLRIDAAGATRAIHDGGSTLYVTSGTEVVSVELEGLTQTDAWEMGEEIRGVQVATRAGRLYVGLRDRVAVLDAATGNEVDSIDPPDVGEIVELGPVFPAVRGGRQYLTCAC